MKREKGQQVGASGRRRRRLWLGGAVLLALGALWLATRPPAEPPLPPPAAMPPPRQPVVFAAVSAGPPADTQAGPLPEAVQRYLESTVYPPTSGRLTRDDVDLLEPNRRHERPHPIADTLGPDRSRVVSVLFTADRYYYTGDDVVRATLETWRGGQPFAPVVVEASAQREGRGGLEGDLLRFDFVFEDGRPTAVLPLDRFADHHGPILLTVRFEYAPGEVHEETLRLFHTPVSLIPARLSGQLRDSVRDGSLLLELGVQVDQPGFYRFDANVYDAAGEPVAWSTFKGELASGASHVPLEVFGKVLHDAGASGPFTVGEVRGYRFLDGQYPDRERLPDASERWTTRSYPPDAFSDAVWTSEHKERMVELMLQDAAAGISLDVPPSPAAGATPGPRPPDDEAEPPTPPGPAQTDG